MELIIIQYLNSKGIKTYGEVPEERPERFVVVQKVGGYVSNQIEHSSIALMCYAPTLYEAATFNEEVQQKVDGLINDNRIAQVELVRSYNFTDPRTKNYRYQSIYRFTFHD